MKKLVKNRLGLRRILPGVLKRKKILLSLAALVVIVTGVILWSRWDENEYQAHYKNHFLNARTNIDKVLFSSDSNVKFDDRISDISAVQAKISNEIKNYCTANSYAIWKNLYSSYRDKLADCERQKSRLNDLLVGIGEMTGYLKSEKSIASFISIANTKTNQSNSEGKFGEIEDYWRQASLDISKISGNDQNKEIIKLASDKVSVVADAWQKLSASNTAENQQQFDEARLGVTDAYSQLAGITDESKEKLNNLINGINVSYGKIF